MARSAVTKGQLQKVSFEVGVTGLDEINQNIAERLDRMTGMQAKKIWMRAALAIVREIRDNIHSITGRLSSGIFAVYGTKNKPNVLVGVSLGGRGKSPHGWVVEHGHALVAWGHRLLGREVPAHPYFKTGVKSARPVAAAIIVEGMRDLALKD